MKKIIMAALVAACLFSASAMSFGVRGDVDIGLGNLETTTKDDGTPGTKPNYQKGENVISGSAGVWFDMPIINLGIVSVGLRPECEVGFNQGCTITEVKDGNTEKVSIKKTDLTVPLYLDACVNLSILRVSAGVGPYVTMPLTFAATEKQIGGKTISTPKAGWDSHSWGLGGYVQAGLKLGAGYLMGDVRVSAPFDTQELLKVGTDESTVKSKTYKVSAGAGYEFKF